MTNDISAPQFDDILKRVGQFGRYQFLQLGYLWIAMVVVVAHGFVFVFIGAEPSHRCRLSDLPLQWTNLTSEEVSQLAYPASEPNCIMYEIHAINWTTGNFTTWISVEGKEIKECLDGWSYDTGVYTSTIVSEWDLVCDRSWYQSLITSIFFAGRLVGSTVSGYFADRFGRQPVFLVCLCMLGSSAIVSYFSNAIWIFSIFFFMQGAAQMSLASLIIILGCELVGPRWRTLAASSCQIAYVGGEILFGGGAYLVRDWRNLQLVIGIAAIPLLSGKWFLPESARWLLSVNKTKAAKSVLVRMARINKTVFDPELLDHMARPKEHAVNSTFAELFKNWNVTKVASIIWFNSFVHHLIYHGFHINTPNLAGDTYLNFFISGCAEMLALLLTIPVQEKLGRRISLLIYCGISAVGAISAACSPPNLHWLSVGSAMVGKFGVGGAINVLEIMTVEVFPTSLRIKGYGISKSLGHLAGMIAPYVVLLRNINGRLSQIVFASLALIVAVVAWNIPETSDKSLSQTLDDITDKQECDNDPADNAVKLIGADQAITVNKQDDDVTFSPV